jgi:hypothetical protein
MLTWSAPSSKTDLFPYRGKEYSLGLVHRDDRSRYVIEDESGTSVGEFSYASDGWMGAWRTFRDLEPSTAAQTEQFRRA